MYTDKNIIYADAGNYLKYKNQVAFQFAANEQISEHALILDDMFIKNNIAYYNNGLCAQKINPNWKYADYKREIIKKRYSNDDQIALILNKDDSEEDFIKYNKMMEWRQFASQLATKILNLIQNELD